MTKWIYSLIDCIGISKSNNVQVPCEIHKQSIVNTIIHGIDESIFETEVEEMPSDEISEQFDDEIEYLEQLSSPFTAWLNDIAKAANETVAESDDGDRDNIMYKPIFGKDFIRLCKILPLWSGISCDLFELTDLTFSSANVESDMKNVKQFLENVIPCSPDIFVEEHIGMLKGSAIEASQYRNYVEFVGNTTEKSKQKNSRKKNSSHSSDTEVSIEWSDVDQSEPDTEYDETNSGKSSNTEDEQNGSEKPIKTRSKPAKRVQRDRSESPCGPPSVSCRNGGKPSGGHRCIECKKAVHILPCCSISIGDEEGYGERRMCNACARPDPSTLQSPIRSSASQTVSEMGYNESWNKTKQNTKGSKYIKKAPNWNLNTNIGKKVKLGMLKNGNKSNITYKVDKNKSVAVTNTCAFDSICQVNVF